MLVELQHFALLFRAICGPIFLVSFLVGSIPFGLIVSKVFCKTDIREHGSGNIGATNALRSMGKRVGAAVFLLDFSKGLVVSVAIVLFAGVPWGLLGVSGFAADLTNLLLTASLFGCVLGHIFSPWLRFKGGKGISVAIGCLSVSFGILFALFLLAVFIVVVAATRYVSLGSIVAACCALFIAVFLFWANPLALVFCVATIFFILFAHRENMRRLREGTESRIGVKTTDGEKEPKETE